MRRLTLTEGEPARLIELSTAEAAALDGAELATVTRTPNASGWSVVAGTKVGVVRIGDLQITIKPKIPIPRLVFLLGYAARPTYWRDHTVLLDPAAGLTEALAHAFTRLATRAVEQGVLQGYRTVEESLPLVRGRIRVREQISRRYGSGLPLEVTYDDFTVDVAENQILLAASSRLLRLPGLPTGIRTGLQRLRLRLVGVSELSRGEVVPRWVLSRLNTRYHSALHLAELILAGNSFEQRVGETQVSGFVVDMWRIFEDFVTTALAEALAGRGHASLQHRMHLDEAERVDLRPDFVWKGFAGQRIVLDAKYKAEKPSGFPQADLYQILAYCTVLGLPAGHLVYAGGNEAAMRHAVRRAGVVIHCHALDLDQEPASLLRQVDELAESLVVSANHSSGFGIEHRPG